MTNSFSASTPHTQMTHSYIALIMFKPRVGALGCSPEERYATIRARSLSLGDNFLHAPWKGLSVWVGPPARPRPGGPEQSLQKTAPAPILLHHGAGLNARDS